MELGLFESNIVTSLNPLNHSVVKLDNFIVDFVAIIDLKKSFAHLTHANDFLLESLGEFQWRPIIVD